MFYKPLNVLLVLLIAFILLFKLLPETKTYFHIKENNNKLNAEILSVKQNLASDGGGTAVKQETFNFLSFLRTNGIKYRILDNKTAVLKTNYRIIKYLPKYVLIQSISNNNIKLSY